MPAKQIVTFTKNGSNGKAPVNVAPGVWDLKVPASPPSFAVTSTTQIDLNLQVSIPSGYFAIITASGNSITGAANCRVITQLLRSGDNQDILINVANIDTVKTPTADTVFARLVVIKETEYKHEETGTWST